MNACEHGVPLASARDWDRWRVLEEAWYASGRRWIHRADAREHARLYQLTHGCITCCSRRDAGY